MKDFNKGGRFGGGGGGFKGGFNRGASGGGGGFGGAPRGDFSRPKEMHQATCANCGKGCEVPFRPNGKKPVFCKECFTSGKTEGSSQGFSRPDSAPRPAYRPEGRPDSRPHGGEVRTEDLKPRLEAIDAKLNTLMKMVEGLKHTAPAAKEGVSAAVKAALKPKKTKKVSKKK